MTIMDPVPPQPPAPRWSGCAYHIAVLISFLCGMFGNLIVLISVLEGQKYGKGALLIFLVPGGFFCLLSLLPFSKGIRQGLLLGGCTAALLGGICGGVITTS
jgi:hypothetical protein